MEKLYDSLTIGLYCVGDSELQEICARFENELNKFKSSVHQDLLDGLKTDKTK